MDTAPSFRRDALVAGLLALVLGAAWAARAWDDLVQLRLPDTDDLVRLQQIRDWLAGQAWGDLTQHRIGAGVPMHWSRLADLVPGGAIAALTPLVGRHVAEMTAVVVWPPLLFAAALLLVARIARTVGADAATATVVAAIAYPATTLFLPGRIDHHGLQMVLLLGATLALLRPPSPGAGVAAGLLAAASLVVGLETVPVLAAIGVVAVAAWMGGRDARAQRLGGVGVGAAVGLAAARGLFMTDGWNYPACDGFTGAAWRAAVALAAVPLLLATFDRWLMTPRRRAAAGGIVGAIAIAVALSVSPACLSPYGAVDPVMGRVWLARVGEAQPLFAAPFAQAAGYAGVMLAGIAASVWQLRATRTPGWAVLLVLQLAALATTVVQLRGAYAGALLAAPGLSAVIAAARARGALTLAGAWAASAGMLYPLAAEALTPPRLQTSGGQGDCASPALLAALARLPAGEVIAPIDAGAAVLAATRHRVVAAPYHRNGLANLDAWAFYSGAPAGAATVAARWRVDYALACAAMPGAARAGSSARALAAGTLPGWHRVAIIPDGAAIYRRNGLWERPGKR